MMEGIRGMAREAGRNPSDLKMVVRAFPFISSEPMGNDRMIFMGSEDQIKADIKALEDIGTDEVFFDPTPSPDGTSVDGFLKVMEQMKELASNA